MAKWQIVVNWECEVEADGEGDALMQADMSFSLMREARAEEITKDACEGCGDRTDDLKADAGDNIICAQCRALPED